MRISDWSSDVCSSDLDIDVALLRRQDQRGNRAARARIVDQRRLCAEIIIPHILLHRLKVPARLARGHVERDERGGIRSEEHTSELQSLMRISYAVFCLKKKKTKTTADNAQQT